MKKGEEVIVKIEYDLFGYQLKGEKGVYTSTNKSTKKLLIYFPKNKEWGEFFKQQIKRIEPGVVSVNNKNFISRIIKLDSSYKS